MTFWREFYHFHCKPGSSTRILPNCSTQVQRLDFKRGGSADTAGVGITAREDSSTFFPFRKSEYIYFLKFPFLCMLLCGGHNWITKRSLLQNMKSFVVPAHVVQQSPPLSKHSECPTPNGTSHSLKPDFQSVDKELSNILATAHLLNEVLAVYKQRKPFGSSL